MRNYDNLLQRGLGRGVDTSAAQQLSFIATSDSAIRVFCLYGAPARHRIQSWLTHPKPGTISS
jgi:hypothetical protein